MEEIEHKDKDCECPIYKEGVACPKCNSKDYDVKATKKEEGIEIKILECKKCKGGFMDVKIMNPKFF